MAMPYTERDAWVEYDHIAKWCAQRNIAGKQDDELPPGISVMCHDLINDDIDAFQQRVRLTAYALKMQEAARTAPMHGESSEGE